MTSALNLPLVSCHERLILGKLPLKSEALQFYGAQPLSACEVSLRTGKIALIFKGSLMLALFIPLIKAVL
jgi:hypothetical protein